jgi:alpha-beta hydrolase superfamily lysophospholipase
MDNLKHVEGGFAGQQNHRIYYQGWLPEKEPGAILLVAHGLAEHGGRYRKLAERFVPLDYGVFAIDHQGHGKSQGRPGYVNHFQDYLVDLGTFHNIIRGMYPNTRTFLLGHSMGGTITAAYAIQHQEKLNGLVLSGASIITGEGVNRPMVLAARLLSRLVPEASVSLIDPSDLSRDPAVVAAYRDDPLVYHGKISIRLGTEMLRTMREIQRQMTRIKLPVLIMHGSADRLSNPAGSEMLFRGISSPDRALKQYPSLYHEILNEPECETVLSDLENWLKNV